MLESSETNDTQARGKDDMTVPSKLATGNVVNEGIPLKLSTKTFDTQEVAIQSLSNEFLDVSDTSLETRTYLVATTLPVVVLGLDKLLREVEHRGLLSRENRQSPTNNRPKFDAINWLGKRKCPINDSAQYLYRNNPRFTDATPPNDSQVFYQAGLKNVATKLKTRNFELETSKRAKMKADEIARRQKEQEEMQARIVQEQARNAAIEDVLPDIFEKWAFNLLRSSDDLYVTKKELVGRVFP